jgi:hypothetical protein
VACREECRHGGAPNHVSLHRILHREEHGGETEISIDAERYKAEDTGGCIAITTLRNSSIKRMKEIRDKTEEDRVSDSRCSIRYCGRGLLNGRDGKRQCGERRVAKRCRPSYNLLRRDRRRAPGKARKSTIQSLGQPASTAPSTALESGVT